MIRMVRLGMTGLKAAVLRTAADGRAATGTVVAAMLLAVVVLFGSCSNEDNIFDNAVDREIGFTAYTGKMTKAEIINNDSLAKEGGFIVWGYKAVSLDDDKWLQSSHSSEIYTVFDSVRVYSKSGDGDYIGGTSTRWSYDGNKKYWDKAARYSFYAVAPANPAYGKYAITGDNYSKRRITITGAKSGLAKSSDDFMVSRSGQDSLDLSGKDYSQNAQNYDFQFYHTMTKLIFKLKKSNDNIYKLTVNELIISGFNAGDGTFRQDSTQIRQSLNCNEWAIPTQTAGSYTLVGSGSSQAKIEITTTDAIEVTDEYIVVPQTIAANKLKFSVKYDIAYDDGTTDNFEALDSVDVEQIWGTDSKITYTLTIGPPSSDHDIIKFDVNGISNWTSTENGLNFKK